MALPENFRSKFDVNQAQERVDAYLSSKPEQRGLTLAHEFYDVYSPWDIFSINAMGRVEFVLGIGNIGMERLRQLNKNDGWIDFIKSTSARELVEDGADFGVSHIVIGDGFDAYLVRRDNFVAGRNVTGLVDHALYESYIFPLKNGYVVSITTEITQYNTKPKEDWVSVYEKKMKTVIRSINFVNR